MLITNLPHFEKIESSVESDSITGGTQLSIDALAIALGDGTLAEGTTNIQIRTIANGKGTIARGKGSALAIGDTAFADVSYSAAGFDKVKVKGRSATGKNFAFDSIKVIALDLPNKK